MSLFFGEMCAPLEIRINELSQRGALDYPLYVLLILNDITESVTNVLQSLIARARHCDEVIVSDSIVQNFLRPTVHLFQAVPYLTELIENATLNVEAPPVLPVMHVLDVLSRMQAILLQWYHVMFQHGNCTTVTERYQIHTLLQAVTGLRSALQVR